MLEREQLDAIAIAVTPDAQYEIAKTAIGQGLHVFAEKPLAADVEQARELVALATRAQIVHGLDFIFPEINAWKLTKELIDTQAFGPLQHLEVNWDFLSYNLKNNLTSWKTRVTEGGGALAFFFSHGLHYLEHFGGQIEDIRASLQQFTIGQEPSEVGADLELKFVNRITGTAHINSNNRERTRHQLIFTCADGRLTLENSNRVVDGFTLTVTTPDGTRQLAVVPEIELPGEDERAKIVRKLASRFVTACKNRTLMSPSFHDGLRVHELIEIIRQKQRQLF
jgi:predicted dehydrogenase